jgi:hypothetical protein
MTAKWPKMTPLQEVEQKLPAEGQKWLSNLCYSDRVVMLIRLGYVGEGAFLKNWPVYQQELKELHFMWG